MATISEIKANVQGRARLNRFRVTLPTPEGVIQDVLVKSTKLPGRSFEDLSIKHRGATVKFAGEPVYNDWSVEVYSEDYAEYEKFFNWMNRIGENVDINRGAPSDYKVSGVRVDQIGLDNNIIATVYLDGVFPKGLEDVTFDSESNEIGKFSVTFSIDAIRFEKA